MKSIFKSRFSSELWLLFSVSVASHAVMLPFSHGAEQEIGFNRDIRPILADRCFHCHGPDEADRKADLRLDQLDDQGHTAEMLGGGDAETSELIQRITSSDPDVVMPPPDSHKEPLTPEEVDRFRLWVDQGAEYESFWAFTPIQKPEVPALDAEGDTWALTAIDHFVARRHVREGVEPSPAADRRTLIRRLALDLTGLPPSPDELDTFLANESNDDYEQIVDYYLKSSRYGEHMARYWLDLVRFADTNGIHHDHYRDLTPYRTWVIRSFNRNLPYDEFVRDQVAGDLLPEASDDQLTASGFNRLHMIIDRGTMLPEESLARNVIDRVTAVGTAFMGLTVGCAVCHDHKYDPITAKEFYQLYAFFNNLDATPETGGRSGTDFQRGLQPPYIELPSAEQRQQRAEIEMQLASANGEHEALKKWFAANPEKTSGETEATDTSTKDDAEQSETPSKQDVSAERESKTAKLEQLSTQIKSLTDRRNRLLLEIPAAMVMKERSERRPSHVMIRGAYDQLGEEVQRGTPAFLPPLEMANPGEATRLDFAQWLVSPEHPLTARVTVNRYWQQLFGVGLVKTSEDLGAQGEWPSHPDLLDYLASAFVDSGWDVKSLMKLMVMSQTYRQRSEASPEQYAKDPENRLLARGSRYRLDAEVIRDQMLAVSGLLKEDIGGKSVKPPQPEGLWQSVALPSSFPNRFVADEGDNILRRSVYTFWKRGLPPPQMTILNAPAREECVARRERTNTPLQALLLMNEQQALDSAKTLAVEICLNESPDSIADLYERITGRLPDESERQMLLSALSDFESYYESNPDLAAELVRSAGGEGIEDERLAAWTMLVNAVFNLDIAKTRS